MVRNEYLENKAKTPFNLLIIFGDVANQGPNYAIYRDFCYICFYKNSI